MTLPTYLLTYLLTYLRADTRVLQTNGIASLYYRVKLAQNKKISTQK